MLTSDSPWDHLRSISSNRAGGRGFAALIVKKAAASARIARKKRIVSFCVVVRLDVFHARCVDERRDLFRGTYMKERERRGDMSETNRSTYDTSATEH